jgi:hypothetical protein
VIFSSILTAQGQQLYKSIFQAKLSIYALLYQMFY